MSDTRGIFLLSEIFEDIREGDGVDIKDVFIIPPDSPLDSNASFMWVSGGGVSTTEKIQYSNDTASTVPAADIPGPTRKGMAGLSGATAAFFLGGREGSTHQSDNFKLTYSTTSTALAPGMDLYAASGYATGLNASPSTGYYVGGVGASIYTSVSRSNLSSDTIARIPATNVTSSPGLYLGGGAGNSTQGYVVGGTPSSEEIIEKFVYATETITGSSMSPNTTRAYGKAACGDSNTGYFSGGQAPTASPFVSYIDKITYSSDTFANIPGTNLTESRNRHAGSGQPSHGYFAGGGPSPFYSSTDKFTIATETCALSPNAQLSSARDLLTGTSSLNNGLPGLQSFPVQQWTTGITPQPNIGYTLGGGVPYTNKINKFDMSTETASNPGSTLPQPQGYTSNGSSRTDAYIFGGTHSTAPYVFADCYTVEYSSETAGAIPGANLTAARYGVAGTTSADAVYSAGGFTPSLVSRMDKMNFSDETTVQVTNGSLTRNEGYATTMGSQSTGYWGGSGASDSNFDKLSYSTDTTVNSPTMSVANPYAVRKALTGDGFAFINGGPGTHTQVERADFSTETVSPVPSANLVKTQNHSQAGFNNNDFGYFAGGTPGVTSEIDKLTYSSSTVSASPSQLVTAVYATTGSSPRSYNTPQAPLGTPTPQTFPVPVPDGPPPITGYLVSGTGGSGNLSSSSKLNMSTDAWEAVPSMTAPLGSPDGSRGYASGMSSPTNGYVLNGYSPNFSNAVKITYLTETAAIIPGNSTNTAHRSTGGSGNKDVGYSSGGWSSSQQNYTDKLTYATDNFAAAPGANLSSARGSMGGTGNQSYVYYICGNSGPASRSTVDKITISGDTLAQVPGAADPTARQHPRTNYYPSPERAYSSGGYESPSASYFSLTTKLNFSDETSAAVPGGNLNTPISNHQEVGNTTTGYYGGGSDSSNSYSFFDKLNFSTETMAASPGSNFGTTIKHGTGISPYQNNNPAANIPLAPNPTPVIC